MPGSWCPTWHYGARSYHDEGIHDDAPWFREICPSTIVNRCPEMTLPQCKRGRQTSPLGPFYGVGLSTQSLNS